ncbi:MAG: hypothetical protein ABSG99_07310 [Sedimentisphaerales bacterium]
MANIYVNHTGSSTPPYDTEAKAARNIQVALDAAASGDIVWIKADQNYVMNGTDQQAAQFDVDVNNNVTIKGYYSTIGDQDYGGTYYKDPDHGWAVIDANNGAFTVFSAGDKDKLVFSNIKTINVNSSYYPLDLTPTAGKYGYVVRNCWITGGYRAITCNYLHVPIIQDCKFTGTYGDQVVYFGTYITRGTVVEGCQFAHSNAIGSIYCNNNGAQVIYNNTFNINGTVTSVISLAYAVVGLTGFITNNVIRENTGGAITNGINIPYTTANAMIFNNIIVGCTTSINDLATVSFGGWNCFYNNGSNWTLRNGDIVADPQFMNAPNGDFRLKPTSPCLNTGKPTLGGGYTSMGVWQRKSLLRWK